MPFGSAKETIIANFDKPLGQDVLQKTTKEFLGRQAANSHLASVRNPIAESDSAIGHFEDAAITDRHAKNVRSQVLQGPRSIANWFAVDNPLFGPDLRWHVVEQVCSLQSVAELGPEQT